MNDLSKNFIINKEEFKRLRKLNAIKLPEEIKEDMIPKYIVYYKFYTIKYIKIYVVEFI